MRPPVFKLTLDSPCPMPSFMVLSPEQIPYPSIYPVIVGAMSGEVTPLLRCHHITDPCNNAISLHKYLSRRSQMAAGYFCCCLGSDVTLSIVLCNAIMLRVESKDSSIRPRFRYPPHNLRGGQLSTSNIVSQSHSAASLPHLLSVEDTEGRSPP